MLSLIYYADTAEYKEANNKHLFQIYTTKKGLENDWAKLHATSQNKLVLMKHILLKCGHLKNN